MPRRGKNVGYLHGYTPKEQRRLFYQATLFEKDVYPRVNFRRCKSLLEVGCGVGAQTAILLRRFPKLRITSVDLSEFQLQAARRAHKKSVARGRVQFIHANAEKLPFPTRSFDSAFICWFLEHVPDPLKILREVRSKLTPGSQIYCNEVMNACFYLNPYSPATLEYWFHFNDHQWTLGGDPFAGAKLFNLLKSAGYKKIQTELKTHHYDNRDPEKRARFIEDRISLLESAAPALLSAKRVTPKLVREMKTELRKLKKDPNAVFLFSWVQASAQA